MSEDFSGMSARARFLYVRQRGPCILAGPRHSKRDTEIHPLDHSTIEDIVSTALHRRYHLPEGVVQRVCGITRPDGQVRKRLRVTLTMAGRRVIELPQVVVNQPVLPSTSSENWGGRMPSYRPMNSEEEPCNEGRTGPPPPPRTSVKNGRTEGYSGRMRGPLQAHRTSLRLRSFGGGTERSRPRGTSGWRTQTLAGRRASRICKKE